MSSALSDAEEKAERAHNSYRGAGIALMVSITGLSAGIFHYLEKHNLPILAFSFVFPVVGALLQQSAHYAASMFLARGYFSGSRWHMLKSISDNLYTLSDALCLLTVTLFFGLSIWSGVTLGYTQMTIGGGLVGFLIVLIGFVIIRSGLKKGRS